MTAAGKGAGGNAWRRLIQVILLTAALAPAGSIADANQGELGGYRLGNKYPFNADTKFETAADRSLKIMAQAPVKPGDIPTVYLYATPATHTIGKIVYHRGFADLAAAEALATDYQLRLEALYPGWERLKAPIPMGRTGGAMLSRLRQGPYALIVFYRGTEQGAEMLVELEYESASPARKAWKAQLKTEASAP